MFTLIFLPEGLNILCKFCVTYDAFYSTMYLDNNKNLNFFFTVLQKFLWFCKYCICHRTYLENNTEEGKKIKKITPTDVTKVKTERL